METTQETIQIPGVGTLPDTDEARSIWGRRMDEASGRPIRFRGDSSRYGGSFVRFVYEDEDEAGDARFHYASPAEFEQTTEPWEIGPDTSDADEGRHPHPAARSKAARLHLLLGSLGYVTPIAQRKWVADYLGLPVHQVRHLSRLLPGRLNDCLRLAVWLTSRPYVAA